MDIFYIVVAILLFALGLFTRIYKIRESVKNGTFGQKKRHKTKRKRFKRKEKDYESPDVDS